MPQTRFVTEKAVNMGLKILVVVNKIDRDGCDPHGTVDATFDLLDNLGATHEQLDFPSVFVSARERYAVIEPDDPDAERLPISRVLDLIIEHAPAPKVELEAPSGPETRSVVASLR
jgi:GTP-binding protein